jgi:predicted phage-related endonuclease
MSKLSIIDLYDYLRHIGESKMKSKDVDRRGFIGGSDARTIMGNDEIGLIRLWREKRGEVAAEDLSGNLAVQLGSVTEDLNRRWFERNSGNLVRDVQRHIKHPVIGWMAATLDGIVEGTGAVFEAKHHPLTKVSAPGLGANFGERARMKSRIL